MYSKNVQAYVVLLHFTDATFFYRLKVYGNPVEQVYQHHLFTGFVHFSLCITF